MAAQLAAGADRWVRSAHPSGGSASNPLGGPRETKQKPPPVDDDRRDKVTESGFQELLERYHESLDAFVTGDPEPTKLLWSRADDVTLANPLGPPARGWSEVAATIDRAAAQIREGEPCNYELVSGSVLGDLGYNLEIERTRAKVGPADEVRAITLRVTTIFRREAGEWKIVHRHADPLTDPRSLESIAR